MTLLCDWILIILSSIYVFVSLKRILNYTSKTVADYIIIVIYCFNCLPVLLDHIFGIPKYAVYLNIFAIVLNNQKINLIYSLYISASISIIFFYSIYQNRLKKEDNSLEINYINYDQNHPLKYFNNIIDPKYLRNLNYLLNRKNHKTGINQNTSIVYSNSNANYFILFSLTILPFFYILITGNLVKYFTYGNRQLADTFYQINDFLILISIYAFSCLFFARERKRIHYLMLLFYSFLLIWINGKRYIIVMILLMYLFFYLNSICSNKAVFSLKKMIFILAAAVLLFYFIYALYIKPTASATFDSLYMNFRIDFGRDDVTKFVLYRENVSRNPILEYRGETILSTIFMLVPRSIWPSKPFPHYRYLTAAIYNTSVLNIPAGITPSLFEMSVANFGTAGGILFANALLLVACIWADRCKSIPRKALYLLLIVGMLTQSMDALLAYFIIAPLSALYDKLKNSMSEYRFQQKSRNIKSIYIR